MLYVYYITNSIGADFDYGILRLGFLEFIQNYNYGANWWQIHARMDNRGHECPLLPPLCSIVFIL